jgi:four helix bundle protein
MIQPLDTRTLQFSKRIRIFVRKLPKSITNIEDGKQLTRSSGSVGANYIEANECLSEKDRTHRFRISKKEAKESIYWLELIECQKNSELEKERQDLVQEATELVKILTVIIRKRTIIDNE